MKSNKFVILFLVLVLLVTIGFPRVTHAGFFDSVFSFVSSIVNTVVSAIVDATNLAVCSTQDVVQQVGIGDGCGGGGGGGGGVALLLAIVCTPSEWNSSSCNRCNTDGTGWEASCTDYGPGGASWCSCNTQCTGASYNACMGIVEPPTPQICVSYSGWLCFGNNNCGQGTWGSYDCNGFCVVPNSICTTASNPIPAPPIDSSSDNTSFTGGSDNANYSGAGGSSAGNTGGSSGIFEPPASGPQSSDNPFFDFWNSIQPSPDIFYISPSIVSFTANPSRLLSSHVTKLSWSASGDPLPSCTIAGIGLVTGKTPVSISGGNSGNDVASSPLTENTLFTISCSNAGGSDSRSLNVSVVSPSFVEF